MTKYQAPLRSLLAATIVAFAMGNLLRPGGAAADHHGSAAKVKRIGMVIGIKPDQIDAYKKFHADNNRGVRDLLSKVNMRNFSVFMRQLYDGKTYLFGYYEYVGDDFDADMAWLAVQEQNKDWLKITDAMQIPLQRKESWAEM